MVSVELRQFPPGSVHLCPPGIGGGPGSPCSPPLAALLYPGFRGHVLTLSLPALAPLSSLELTLKRQAECVSGTVLNSSEMLTVRLTEILLVLRNNAQRVRSKGHFFIQVTDEVFSRYEIRVVFFSPCRLLCFLVLVFILPYI